MYFLCRCNISPLLTFHKCILFFPLRASYSFATRDLTAFALERKTRSTSPFSGGSGTPGRRHVSITVIQRDAEVLHPPCVTALLLGATTVCVWIRLRISWGWHRAYPTSVSPLGPSTTPGTREEHSKMGWLNEGAKTILLLPSSLNYSLCCLISVLYLSLFSWHL